MCKSRCHGIPQTTEIERLDWRIQTISSTGMSGVGELEKMFVELGKSIYSLCFIGTASTSVAHISLVG